MAANLFIGWSREDLLAARRSIQTALITGQPTEVILAGVKTTYKPSDNLEAILNAIQYAISQLPDADPTEAGDQDPARNRPAVSRPIFY